MIVFTTHISSRAKYIFSTLLPALGVDNYNLTDDKVFYIDSKEAKINYSREKISPSEFWIKPADLLFEKEIKPQVTDCFIWNEIKAFFKTTEGDLPFDIFAASFYLITRYEEYLPHKRDFYGRYGHENGLAFKEEFLNVPLINMWLQQFAKELLKKFPGLYLSNRTFRFIPTYDIDIAWSYLNKGWLRNMGGLIHAMMESEWLRAGERVDVVFGNKKDPFDSYQWLNELHEKYGLKPVYFFLLSKQNKDYDKNILPSNASLKNLVRHHHSKYAVGIHPSWQSGDKPDLLKEEIQTLETITNGKINKSRQHYIRMTLPETYRQLISAGITEDYSMGYGSINGFRASYCLPYKWYDLQKEEETNLTLFPFCYMDANSFYEQHATAKEALNELEHYFSVTKRLNGLLISIWHNHFLGTDTMFKGWREMYSTAIERICQD